MGSLSVHDDVLNANPQTDQEKKALVDELKNRAKGSISVKNLPEAIRLYSKAIEVDPKNAILYGNRSMVYLTMGNKDGALSDEKKCLQCDRLPQG